MKLERLLSKRFLMWLMKDGPPRRKLLSNIERVKQEIQPCDVILVEGRSRISAIIKIITKSPWSHAAIYIGNIKNIHDPELIQLIEKHLKPEDRTHQHFVIEGVLGRGFIISPLSIYQDDHMRICRPTGISEHDKQQVLKYAFNSLGKAYSTRHILDLARFLLPLRILPSRWRSSLFKYKKGSVTDEICSSMIAQAFDSVNFPVLPELSQKTTNQVEFIRRNPLLYVPCDFDYSPFFEIVKYPLLNEYCKQYKNIPWNNSTAYHNDEINDLKPDPS